jgi:hypothetical protein
MAEPDTSKAMAGLNQVTRAGNALLWNGEPWAVFTTDEGAAFALIAVRKGVPACFGRRDWK